MPKWYDSGSKDAGIPSGAPRRMSRANIPPVEAMARAHAIIQQLRSVGTPATGQGALRAAGQSVKWAK